MTLNQGQELQPSLRLPQIKVDASKEKASSSKQTEWYFIFTSKQSQFLIYFFIKTLTEWSINYIKLITNTLNKVVLILGMYQNVFMSFVERWITLLVTMENLMMKILLKFQKKSFKLLILYFSHVIKNM